jgi:hypothetical protein
MRSFMKLVIPSDSIESLIGIVLDEVAILWFAITILFTSERIRNFKGLNQFYLILLR